MTDPLLNFPGYALRRAANATMAELATRLAPLGLRQTDATVMILIDADPGITASSIGRTRDIQRANMVPLLKRLDDGGLIDKQPIDGKSLGLTLTEAGRLQLKEVRAVVDAFEQELLDKVPEEHRPHLVPALNALWR